MLDEYVKRGLYNTPTILCFTFNIHYTTGPEKFSHQVASIAPSLHALRAESAPALNGVYVYRLIFAVRLAEYHQRKMSGELQDASFDLVTMFKEGIAPKGWWAVLLYDAIDLLNNGELFACF